MSFKKLVAYFQELERISSRNEMIILLAEIFKEAEVEEIAKICYLSLGRLAPKYRGVEFNIAEKMMIQILARAYGREIEEIRRIYKEVGDLGEVAIQIGKKGGAKRVSVGEVFGKLYEIATASGEGSVEQKVGLFANLLCQLDALSAKYVVRIPLRKLRLGFSDMTILDALSWTKVKNKSLRPQLERAYNLCADIGKIAEIFKMKGVAGIEKVRAEVGIPIRTAQAERLPSAEKIVEKLGRFAVEPKYDGFRVQLHLDKGRKMERSPQMEIGLFDLHSSFVRIFSRNLEDITYMFPDIVAQVQRLPVQKAVFDGEAIAYCEETGEFLPFQETVQRKRRYGIAQKVKEIPLKVFVYDLLLLGDKSLIDVPFEERRRLLLEALGESQKGRLVVARQDIVENVADLRRLFNLYIGEGLEGVMCKKLDSVYQAGARNFNWVKYKRAVEGELADTVDCLVMGYYRGKGKRAGFGIGAFLVGVYDPERENFVTLAKIGTGLTDEEWREMRRRCDRVRVVEKPREYMVDKMLFCDVWVKPAIVVEIKADEITKSPVHTAGKRGGFGLALRFPRLVRFREKTPEQVTTVKELWELYKIQGERQL